MADVRYHIRLVMHSNARSCAWSRVRLTLWSSCSFGRTLGPIAAFRRKPKKVVLVTVVGLELPFDARDLMSCDVR